MIADIKTKISGLDQAGNLSIGHWDSPVSVSSSEVYSVPSNSPKAT